MEKNTSMEQYFVKLNYQKPDGYWVFGKIIEISVEVVHGVNEKNNHDEAIRVAKLEYPGCEIVSVSYE